MDDLSRVCGSAGVLILAVFLSLKIKVIAGRLKSCKQKKNKIFHLTQPSIG